MGFLHILSFTAALSGQASEAKILPRRCHIQRKTHFFSVFDIIKEISNDMMQSSPEVMDWQFLLVAGGGKGSGSFAHHLSSLLVCGK